LGGTAAQLAGQTAAAPGQTYLGQQQAQASALSNYLSQLTASQGLTTGATNIGQAQYALPLSLLGNMQNYLNTGVQAALGGGQLGQIGTQQAQQGLAGLTGLGVLGSNALLGSSSPFASGGLLSGTGSGLLGSTGAGLGTFGAFDPALGGVTAEGALGGTFAGGAGSEALAGTAAGGSGLLGALPFLAKA
jgi:hypothetical protein